MELLNSQVKTCLAVFWSCVRPVLEYGCLTWHAATSKDLKPLENI